MTDGTPNAKHDVRVLYIEDDPIYGQLVDRILTPLGCTVDLAETGEEGLAAFKMSAYDIVAVDYMLPDMSGIKICQELRAINPTLPLVVITGRGKASTPVEALTLDVPHYLEKGNAEHFTQGLINTFRHLIGNLNKPQAT